MPGGCPKASVLTELALGAEVDPQVRAHVESCDACCEAVEEIQENERFLGRAATALGRAADAPRTSTPSLREDAVDGYELLDEIARGGQGVVYCATQIATRRMVAVKVLLSGTLASGRQLRNFEREIEIAASLWHRNLVAVLDSGVSAQGRRYVAMEFVRGVPIDRFVAEHFGRPRKEGGATSRKRVDAVVRLVRDVAAGVGHAHASGVIHRDLKPSNILVEADGTPRVLDFGLARTTEWPTDVTISHDFAGTPAYAAPEQLGRNAAKVGPRTDVYALGLILYRLLTGKHPYPCDGSFVEVANHACKTEPLPPSRLVPRLPADVETIVLKCLAKARDRRYANAAAMAADLDDYLEGRPISARRDSTAYVLGRLAMKHRTATLAGALVVATVVGATIGLAILANDLYRARREIESALVMSEVRRGRVLVKSSPAEAETILWKQAVVTDMPLTRCDPSDPTQPHTLAREAEHVRWALMELYSQTPCVLRATTSDAIRRVGFNDNGSVWVVDRMGVRTDYDAAGNGSATSLPLVQSESESVLAVDIQCQVGVVGGGQTLRVVECGTGRTLFTLDSIDVATTAVSVADDGSVVALRLDNRDTMIIDTRLSRAFGPFHDNAYSVTARVIDGVRSVVIGTTGLSVRVLIRSELDWNNARIAAKLELSGPGQPAGVRGVCPFDGGRQFVFGYGSQLFRANNPDNAPLDRNMPASVGEIAPYEDRGGVAVGLSNGSTALVSLPDLTPIRYLPGAEGWAGRLVLDQRRKLLGQSSGARLVRVFELEDRAWLTRIGSTVATHAGLAIAGDGGTVAWVDERGRLHLLDPAAPDAITTVPAHTDVANSVSFSADGRFVLTCGSDGTVQCYKYDGTYVRTCSQWGRRVWGAVFSPDGRIVSIDEVGAVTFWSSKGTIQRVFKASPGRLSSIAYTPDGKLILLGRVDHRAVALDAKTGEVVFKFDSQAGAVRSVICSDKGVIATGSDDMTVCLWDARTGKLLRKVTGLPWGPYDLAFSPNGDLLAVVGPGRELVVADVEGGEILATFDVHDEWIFAVSFSPDGRKIYTSGQDSYIGVTDLDHFERYIRGSEKYWRARAAVSDAPASR